MLRTLFALQNSLRNSKGIRLHGKQDPAPWCEGANGKLVGGSKLPTSFKQDIPKLLNNYKSFILKIQLQSACFLQGKLIGF